MKRYYEYDTQTKLKRVSPPLSETDLLEAPAHIKYFSNKEELEQFIQMHQDLTSTQNHINHNKEIEDTTSMKLDISDDNNIVIDGPEISITETITPLAKSWGGKRAGSGSKKGQPKSQQTKEKMRLAKLGNKNATKSK